MNQPLIYVIEDDIRLARVLCSLLQRTGYRVESFADGTTALAKFTHQTPDLVLADVVLPDISGIEVLRQIRARDKNLPVILMSGQHSVSTAMEAIGAGALASLEKPLDVHRLRGVLRSALGIEKKTGNCTRT